MQTTDQPTTPRLAVYGASKIIHAPIWRALADPENPNTVDSAYAFWPEIEWTARWPKKLVFGDIPDVACYAPLIWTMDVADVQRADVVLVYSAPEDELRGALVEAGVAIGLGKYVIVVGQNKFYGTWQHHPLVYRVPNLASARTMLRLLSVEKLARLEEFAKAWRHPPVLTVSRG